MAAGPLTGPCSEWTSEVEGHGLVLGRRKHLRMKGKFLNLTLSAARAVCREAEEPTVHSCPGGSV